MRMYDEPEVIGVIGFSKDEVIGEGTYLECLEALRDGIGSAIYGPNGGILHLHNKEIVAYRCDNTAPNFGVGSYLGTWRLLK